MFRYGIHALEGLQYLRFLLEAEGDGDDAYGEHPGGLCLAGDDGRGAGAGAAAHAGGDEHHLGVVVKECLDGLDAFLSLLGCFGRVVAGAKTRAAQLYLDGDFGLGQRLGIGVAKGERHIVDALAEHVLYSVAATAADADDLDDLFLCRLSVVERHDIFLGHNACSLMINRCR